MPFPIDESEVVKFETELGLRLPRVFRERAKQENGGEVATDDHDWQLHPLPDRSDRKRLSRTANHVGLETRNASASDGFPERALCIASNGEGDHLVLTLEGSDLSDVVYIWWHETRELERVAASIVELSTVD